MEMQDGYVLPIAGALCDGFPPEFPKLISAVSFATTCKLLRYEKILFQNAFRAFGRYVKGGHPLPVTNRSLSIIFSDRSELSFMTDGAFGFSCNIVQYRMDYLRSQAREEGKPHPIILVALEELSHALYFILDEWEVKEKVADILAFCHNPIDLGSVYPYRFYPDGSRRFDYFHPVEANYQTR